MPYVRNGGVNIYYELVDGPKPPIVFVHGWTANMNFWKEQRRYFAGRNMMLFIDNRGHGKSDKPLGYDFYRFENFISDLDAVVRETGVEKFVLVGHSFGTMISMKYCSEYRNRVLALILMGGGSRIKLLHRIGYPLAKILASIAYKKSSRLVADLSFGKNAGELKEWGWKQAMDYTPSYVAMYTYKTLTKVNLENVLEKIDCPTLIIVGEEDALLPVSKSVELSRMIENSKLVVIPNSGHCVMLESPSEVNRAMDEFISSAQF